MQAPQPNQVLGDRYRLVRPLGSGGFGAVWYAEHMALHSPVAVKILDPVVLGDEDTMQRFLREARAAAALRSPHVVQILDYGAEAGIRYIVMEVLEGESLEERIERDKRLSVGDIERIVRHVGRAISRAHDAGIVHRDLKPGNIFIVPNDGDDIVKVLDFGVAKATNVALGHSLIIGATPAGTLLGTPHYMSPEQAQGMRNLDFRTDFWSLGVIAYECLLGELPFEGDNLPEVISAICSGPVPVPSAHGKVPHGFDAWFARACARTPSERFESAKQMAAEFTRICSTPRSSTPGPSLSLARTAPAPITAEAGRNEKREPDPAPVAVPKASSPSTDAVAPRSRREGDGTFLHRWWQSARLTYVVPGVAVCVGAGLAWRACASEPVADTPVNVVPLLAAPESKPPLAAPVHPAAALAQIRIAPIEPGTPEAAAPSEAIEVVGTQRSRGAEPTLSAGAARAKPTKQQVSSQPSGEQLTEQLPLRMSRDSTLTEPSGGAPASAQKCEPPWYVDAQGIRRIKEGCL